MAIFNENGQLIDENHNILECITEKTFERIELKKRTLPIDILKSMAITLSNEKKFELEKMLKNNTFSYIGEIKKSTPSMGDILLNFDYLNISKELEKCGVDAISFFTEPHFFKGNDNFLQEISENASVPVIRQDFIIDEYMVYESKLMGASAISLICSILDDEQLEYYFKIADKLGLSVIFETYTKEEVSRAININARIISINNRNLQNFYTTLNNTFNLHSLIPKNILFLSQSGIKTKNDIKKLKEIGVNGIIIGETLLRTNNKKEIFDDWRNL